MNRNQSFFWPSYLDLMISLFFVVLVLFVGSYKLSQDRLKAVDDLVIEAQKARNIKTTIEQLMKEDAFFVYEPEHKRYQLNVDVQFKTGAYAIDYGKINNYYETKESLQEAGDKLHNIINSLLVNAENRPDTFGNISYLLVISGRASKDNFTGNYELSYLRALSLYKFWQQNVADFDDPKYRQIIDLQIAGVGTGGVGRYTGAEEYKNKGFFIQIIPKVGEL